jgi:hypothetical protein
MYPYDIASLHTSVTCVVFRYCSAAGETLQYIAQLYSGDTNWRRLFNMNPSLVDPDLIFTDNKRLAIGNLCAESFFFKPFFSFQTPPCVTWRAGRYRVSRGDTLLALGQRFECSLPSLLRLNPDISDAASINIGQLLCVAPYVLRFALVLFCDVLALPPLLFCDVWRRYTALAEADARTGAVVERRSAH